MCSDPEILIHESPGQGHETPFTSGPYSFKGPEPCPTQPSTPGAAIYARAAAVAAGAAALADDQAKGSSEGPTPRPFSPVPVPMVAEASSKSGLEQHHSSLPPTSRADVGVVSPCQLPPKLPNTRVSGLGDGPTLSRDGLQRSGDSLQLSGDKLPIPGDVCGRPSSEQSRFSGDKPRPSRDGPQIVRKPLFRVCLPLLL